MTTRYRLPDDLGGHPVTVLHGMANTDGRVDFYVDLGGGTFAMTLPLAALIEVEPALPPEPPVGSVVLVGHDDPTELFDGETLGLVYRRYERGWTLPGDNDYRAVWGELCTHVQPPVLLVPAPEPVELPWSAPYRDGVIGVEVFIKDGTARVGVLGKDIGISRAEAREMARALWTAADAEEARS